jgi:hypothetical protein
MEHAFKLIDGIFTPKEASEILLNLYISKLKFHQMKQFSAQERLGEDDVLAIHKIQQLQLAIDKIKEVLQAAQAAKQEIVIESNVSLHLTNKKS